MASCALDVADMGGLSVSDVAEILGVPLEAISEIEEAVCR